MESPIRPRRPFPRRAGPVLVAVALVLAQLLVLVPCAPGGACAASGGSCCGSCPPGLALACGCASSPDMQAADLVPSSAAALGVAVLASPPDRVPLSPGFRPFVPPSIGTAPRVPALAKGSPLRGPPSSSGR